jgi:anionic cell wall polymer biosynthesis LytR-Cps2A-Psr (LCP) family protein
LGHNAGRSVVDLFGLLNLELTGKDRPMQSRMLQKLRSRMAKPLGAAVLSCVVPGLGQAVAGDRRRGAIVLIPFLAVVGAVLIILIFARSSLLGLAVNQTWLTSLLILDGVLFVYRLWAIWDAYTTAAREQPKKRQFGASTGKWATVFAVGLILSANVAVHGAFAQVDMDWQHSLYCLTAVNPCQGPDTGGDSSDPSVNPYAASLVANASPDASGALASAGPVGTFNISELPSFSTTADSENWAADGQLNVLLLGVGVGGDAPCDKPNNDIPCRLGPDTIMVLHTDLATGKSVMIGIGRNNLCVPLPKGIADHYPKGVNGCPPYTWGYQINSLGSLAWDHCGYLPFYTDTCGQARDVNAYQRAIRTFEVTIGGLLDLRIDGTVTINPVGLSTLIDDLGGVTVDVEPSKLYDKPCGPVGTWQQKTGAGLAVPGNATCADAHNGYSVPTGVAGVNRMKADLAGGMRQIVWTQERDIAFVIQPGKQKMGGDWALAYARTRMYTSDFARMARQQDLLKALRAGLDPCTLAGSMLNLLGHIGYAFHTDLPITNSADIQAWAGIAQHVAGASVKTKVLDPTTLGQVYVQGYPAFDPKSWANTKSIVAHSLDDIPVAPGGGSGGAGGAGFKC